MNSEATVKEREIIMSDRTNSQEPQSTTNTSGNQDIEPQDPQPESGFVDCQELMEIRQSSPTNPRVNDKAEANQSEA
ncbi:hypothetical protein [Microseira wollei]|uniref:Uncharacterized protein n=1 Tax=Microseira wollei NIES-4236 TaxID=2530354 RepID=A0AAV3XR55_9CYAN|nr:hypothetical protein [Microseira wollei]GET43334.1 hypothetical protein MiSe_81560 [Microseira wollei NIES-4236]